MGRGDLRSRRGKIARGTSGKTRQKKRRVEISRKKKSNKKTSK